MQVLEKLQQKLPNLNNLIKCNQGQEWWESNALAWREELRQATIKYRNIGYEWNFSQEQIDLFYRYLSANQLLVDCLNSECYVSREVREEIENTLLLPYADLNY